MKREERAVSPLSPESDRGFAVALGSFDGIHAGHVALITRAVSAARERGLCSAVWTFHDDASQLPGKTGTRVITTLK